MRGVTAHVTRCMKRCGAGVEPPRDPAPKAVTVACRQPKPSKRVRSMHEAAERAVATAVSSVQPCMHLQARARAGALQPMLSVQLRQAAHPKWST